MCSRVYHEARDLICLFVSIVTHLYRPNNHIQSHQSKCGQPAETLLRETVHLRFSSAHTALFIYQERGRFDALLMAVHIKIRGGWKNNQEENPTYSAA